MSPRPKNPTVLLEVDATWSQAERIIERLGGVHHLLELLNLVGKPLAPSTVFRWTYPKERGGTGGVIPGHLWPAILQAARMEGIILKPEDLDPRPLPKHTPREDTLGRRRLKVKLKKRHLKRELLEARRRLIK